jgi:hypothetical protein
MRTTPKLVAPSTIAALFLALSACTTSAPAPTAAPPTSASPSVSTSIATPSSPAAATLGPLGYGALKLGATKAEAIASGLTEGTKGTKGACGGASDGYVKGAPRPSDESVVGMLFFSENTGKLIAIYAAGDIATPEGIKLGSTVADLKTAFGTWEAEDGVEGRGTEKVAGNAKAYYRIVVDGGKVVELSLDSINQDCYE